MIKNDEKCIGIDIGNSSIKVVYEDLNDSHTEGVYVKSDGYASFNIIDETKFSKSIKDALDKIHKYTEDDPDKTIVSFSHSSFRKHTGARRLKLREPRTLDSDWLDMLKDNIKRKFQEDHPNLILSHITFTKILVDGEDVTLYPYDSFAKRDIILEYISLIYQYNPVKKMIDIIEEIIPITYSNPSIILNSSLLDEDDKFNGCILLDIGLNHTKVNLYKDGFPIDLRIVKFGGSHITKIIAEQVGVNLKEAETLKKNMYKAIEDGDITKGDLRSVQSSVKKELKVFNEILKDYRDVDFNSGIYLIGGGSLFFEMDDMLRKVTSKSVEYKKVIEVFNESGEDSILWQPTHAIIANFVSDDFDKGVLHKGKNKVARVIKYLSNLIS